MKTLIINNNSKHINDLKKLFPQTHKVVNISELKKSSSLDFDLIVLSGAKKFSVKRDFNEVLKNEVELILNSKKPIIGICFGCELIAYAFGDNLIRKTIKECGIKTIVPTKKSKIFKGAPKDMQVFEAHRWIISDIPDQLEVLAASSSGGVEVFKHKHQPIYGLQFHPEECCDKTYGDEILSNIIDEIF